jgi:hypothetical protein
MRYSSVCKKAAKGVAATEELHVVEGDGIGVAATVRTRLPAPAADAATVPVVSAVAVVPTVEARRAGVRIVTC